MAIHKAPHADLRRTYPVRRQVGIILALSVTVGAFTVPFPGSDEVAVLDSVQEVIELQDIEQSQQVEPPPPPPAALPPPQEVPDNVEIEAEVIEEIELDLTATVVAPPAPPAPSAPPAPVAQRVPPPPPPPEPEPTEPEIFEVAEIQPALIGGLEGLQSRVEYPAIAIQAGVEGQVVIQFVVDERGNVVDPIVLRSPNDLLTEAALKAVQESRFTPGQQRGRPVKVRFAVPVTFTLVRS